MKLMHVWGKPVPEGDMAEIYTIQRGLERMGRGWLVRDWSEMGWGVRGRLTACRRRWL